MNKSLGKRPLRIRIMKSNKLYDKNWFWLGVALIVFLVNQLPFLADMRGMGNDESWYANVAFNLSKGNGLYNTSVGYGGNGNCFAAAMEALAFRIFGYSLFSVRIASVFCGLVTLVIMHFVIDELRVSSKGRALAFLLFVSLPVFNTAYRFGRPEGAALMCLSGGIFFYLRYWRTNKWSDVLGLCLFCFLSTIAHPFALFSFMFMGFALLSELLRNREWKRWIHLSLFVITAIVGVCFVAWLATVYNPDIGGSIFERASPRNAFNAALVYYKDIFFSRYALYSYPIVALLVCSGCFIKENRLRILAWLTLVNGLLFPFVFSTDVVMLPFGWHYVVIVAVFLVGPLFDSLSTQEQRFRKLAFVGAVFYSFVCLVLSYVYNITKYEKCNSVMEKELASKIPQGSLVYGPICQYFCAIDTRYYSDHYYTDLPLQLDFDYLIFNSRDLPLYPMSLEIYHRIPDYDLIYSRDTKQYGTVKVFQRKAEK